MSVEALVSQLEAHPYLLLFPLVAVEGPLATISAGFLVSDGLIGWPVAYTLAVTADLTADTLYYLLGRSARRPWAGRLLHRIGLTQERLAAMEASFQGNDARVLVTAKVADFAAIPVLIAAGLTKVGYGRFLGWNAAATIPKAGVLMLVGFFAGQQALSFAERQDPGSAASLALLALVPVAYLLVKKKVPSRGLRNSIQTSQKEDNR